MKYPPLVSIIMPTYNRANYIRETIASIQNQTYTNWELLIMDDDSDDNTEELVMTINDSRIHFYKLAHTGVINKVKSEGLKRTNGEFVAFIDSDDLWHPGKTEKQVNILINNPDVYYCLTGGYNFKNTPAIATEHYYKHKTGFDKGNLFVSFCKGEVCAFVQVLMARKECFNKVVIYKDDNTISDRYLLSQLTYHFQGILLYEPLFYRRLHESNFSADHTFLKFRKELISEYREYKKNKMLPIKLANSIIFKAYIQFGENAIKNRKWFMAFNNFIMAWYYKPFSIIPVKKFLKVIIALIHKQVTNK